MDEGMDAVLENIGGRAGLGGVTMAAAYHHGRHQFRPVRNPQSSFLQAYTFNTSTQRFNTTLASQSVETVPSGETRHVASAHLVFVGLDENGKPTRVPPVIAESDDEKRRQAQARTLR